MQHFSDTRDLVLSATDLTDFLACPRLTQEQLKSALGLRGKLPRDDSPHGDLVREHGDRYEAEQLERLSALAGSHVAVELPAFGYARADLEAAAEHTSELMHAGVPLIYQAVLFDGRWQGRVDFLRRVETESALGKHAYEVVDTKLARSIKPQVVHQLSLYARLVARVQGEGTDRAHVLLGDGTEEVVELRRYAALHRHVVARLEAIVAATPVDVYPEPVAHCPLCRLERECLKRRRDDDHLSFVAGARRTHRDVLVAHGTGTLEALATLPLADEIPDLAPERLDILRSQAGLQRESRETGLPTQRHLPAERERGYARLPRRSEGDVFFDFEGDPYVGTRGIEYLWGWTTTDGDYECLWAHDDAQEAAALREFIAWIDARRERFPDLHVFHYGAHEASKLKSLAQQHGVGEERIDAWLREGVLVDLYAVVRQAMQVGEESYSLKRLERHYGFERTEHTVRDGGGSIVAYEAWLAAREPELLEAIRRYNREDCLSTAALSGWLLEDRRPHAAVELAADFDELAKPEADETREPAFMADLRPVLEALLDGVATDEDAVVDTDQAERRLLANLLLYHYRESKPQYWHWFAMREMTPEALVDEREALGMVTLDTTVAPVPDKRSLRWTYRFPVQETKLEAGGAFEPFTKKQWKILELTDDRLVLKRGKDSSPPDVRALIPQSPPDGGKVRIAATEVAASLTSDPRRFPALRALLRRDLPTVDLSACGPSVEQLVAATLALGDSYLAVQGPPGSGKTFRGAHMAVAALAAGKRVAVTANSHAAIQNFLRAVEDRAAKQGVTAWRGVYKGDGYESPHDLVESVESDAETFGEFDLVAGTAWLMANQDHRSQFELLFIDEAGQFSLANAAAAGTVARGIVLLGDPQQLPQVNQATHPHGAGASVLGHLLGDQDVIPSERGVFIDVSWRMHPDVCRFISERSYKSELHANPPCALRRVEAPGRLSGAGLRVVAVAHEGCSQASLAEAETIAEMCRELLGDRATVTDDEGTVRPLVPADILVVAPYNLARRRIEEHVPPGVRVGTVDKFQGQEAPVVFFAMTCSSGEDVPRGLGFLFDRNRFNVAISRAQCLAVLVHAPRLLDADCRSLEHMALVDGACRFVELAEPVPLPSPGHDSRLVPLAT
jgi:uncharacterized protein